MYCPHCGKEIADGQAFCQYCGKGVAEPTQQGAGIREKTPWEARETEGFFGGLINTLKSALFTPTEFFRKMSVTGGLTDPLLYALITGMAGMMISYFWQVLLQGTIQNFMPPEFRGAAGYDMFQGLGIAVLAGLSPFMIIFGLFVAVGIIHLFLLMVKGSRHGFEGTFRVVSYSYGANIFQAIPFCGSLIALVWTIVLVIIGLKESQETSGGKAAFAALFPIVLCCAVVAIGAVLMMGVIAASVGELSPQ